jgi:alkanesulfonate monooxygenase SsuD/methylene tetrahydromethanopterin reductase-like flavin-dependent oxidoreductase (luciferase family)
MVEGIAVMKGLFGDGAFTFEGKHYTVTEHDGLPKPVQQPWPPFLIGGGGRRVLTVAAREADIVGINPSIPGGRVDASATQSASAVATEEKVAWVREAAGDRYADIEINVLVFGCVVTDDRQGTAEMMAPLFGVQPDEVVQSPHTLIGPVEAICDDLVERRERWDMSYVVVQGAEAMDAVAPVVARLAGT